MGEEQPDLLPYRLEPRQEPLPVGQQERLLPVVVPLVLPKKELLVQELKNLLPDHSPVLDPVPPRKSDQLIGKVTEESVRFI